MDRRERMTRAINHQPTDYVPYAFHAAASVYELVRQHYDLPDNDALIEFVGNHFVKIGSDFNVNPWAEGVNMKLVPSGGPMAIATDKSGGLHTDEFGCVWDRRGGMPHPVAYPLAESPGMLDRYEMPDPYHEGRFDSAKVLADKHRDKYIFGKLGMAMFERAWSIRGFEQLLADMVERPEFVEELLDRVLYEWNLPIIDQQLAIGIDVFYFADDWGAKTNMIFSPRMWRRFIKPRMAVCYERVKQGGAYVGQHSDGMILPILPDLIEIGVDILNPIQPSVYDPNELKDRYGDKITLYGAIDVETTLPFGTPEDVRREMFERAERLGEGGGYILQSSHTILSDVPMPNVIAFIETCHELAGIDTEQAAAQARSTSAD